MKESDAFVYLAAHDLRAPLMSVKGLLNLMKQEKEKKTLDHYMSLLERSVDKMNQSISDIINYSKNGRVKIVPQDVNLRTIAEDTIQSLRYIKGADAVKIDLSIDQQHEFLSDRKILMSVFSNMISNAIRYRDPGKPSFLKIRAIFQARGVEIAFEDNGIGIDREIQNSIFDKFFLGNSERGGTGLGLYMVRNSIEKMGGSIQVQSAPGIGTTFTIRLPYLSARL